jgi:hypothetical protein
VVTYYGTANPIFWVDIFGQFVLAANSYRYHNAMFEKRKDQKYDDDDDVSGELNRLYVLSIQLRTFLVVFVNLLQIENARTAIYQGACLALVHLIAVYGNPVMRLNGAKTVIEYLMHFQAIIIVFFHNNDHNAATHLVISGILIAVISTVEPFYELNHFFLHLVLLYQTYASSACNASLLMPPPVSPSIFSL